MSEWVKVGVDSINLSLVKRVRLGAAPKAGKDEATRRVFVYFVGDDDTKGHNYSAFEAAALLEQIGLVPNEAERPERKKVSFSEMQREARKKPPR